MVLETPILPYQQWFFTNLPAFLAAVAAAALLGGFIGLLVSAARYGPVQSLRGIGRAVRDAVAELANCSPRRLWAIARLAFQESVRRRVLVVFGVFIVILLFGGWYLDPNSDHPARLYLSFVMTASNYLVLLLAVFLSAFSLPQDIKNKTIFTVVTKPVRAWEIVVGRILGFVGIGTLMLALMGVFSFFFVQRGLRHEHTVDPGTLVTEAVPRHAQREPQETRKTGETSRDARHRHAFLIEPQDRFVVVPYREHTHDVVTRPEDDPRGLYRLGPAKGLLLARVPVIGHLRYLDASGQPSQGINVGYEWKYRKYIEGATLAAAVWRFDRLSPADFPDHLPVEMTLRVFRTYTGDIERGLSATIELVRPAPLGPDGQPVAADGGLRSVPITFEVRDQEIYQRNIPRKIDVVDAEGNERQGDLFKDLVDPQTGELEIWIRCLDPEQYLGMAPADLYLRAADRPFAANFLKGFVSIWFQMLVVTSFGVAFSTFLSGSVAMVATLGAMVMGFFKGFVFDVATGEMPGGGPLESLVRLLKQANQLAELEPGIGTWIMRRIDAVLMQVIETVSYAMPDCGRFNTSNFVAFGFDVPVDLMAQHATIALAYVLVVSVAGYFFFKAREIAA